MHKAVQMIDTTIHRRFSTALSLCRKVPMRKQVKLHQVCYTLVLLLCGASAYAQQAPSSTGNITASGTTCLTTNACISLQLITNTSAVSVTLTGTFSATLVFEKSADNGTTWATQDTQTGTGLNTYIVPALTNFRVRASAYTSGTVGVFINSSQAPVAGGSGSITAGTINTIPKYTAATTIGNSLLTDDGTTLIYTGTGGLKSTPTGGIGGTLTLPEGTTATASAGNDVCYGDSTAHAIKCANNNGSFFSIPQTIATGTSAMGTSAIGSGACATVVSTTATGVLTTDSIIWSPNADPTGVTGYAVSATGSLYIWAYPTADHVNYKVCNNTSGSLTPSALTLNWRVAR